MASNVLKELVEVIGLPACLALTRAYGGRTVRVPIRDSPTHPLTVILGVTAAAKLRAEFGGVHIEIPVERTALLLERNDRIRAEILNGAKIMTTAVRYGLSRKMVRKIVKQRVVGTGPTVFGVS